MIIAIEGASATGKTTWCRSHCADGFVEEASAGIAAPDLYADPVDVANFWVAFNIKRWQAALRLEQKRGVAFCDGDPFHLYFSWSLWRVGALSRDLFDAEQRLYRQAVEKRQIGFADFVCWREVPIEALRRRARLDSTGLKRRHELYLSLIPWMKLWFEEWEKVWPGTLHDWPDGFRPEELIVSRECPRRYDLVAFVRLVEGLDHPTS